jgi:hypothetical protein
LLQCKSMQKQIASSNTFVLRQTLSISSCDGLCTDQNDTAASVHLRDDIAVVCSKLSQTSQYLTSNAKQVVPSNAMERSDLSITTAQRTQFAHYISHTYTHNIWQYFRMTTYLFIGGVRANHQATEFQHHAENCSTDFLLQQWDFGHRHAATPQISPTRGDLFVLARCDAGGGQNAVVVRFMHSCSFRCSLPTLQRKYLRDNRIHKLLGRRHNLLF